MADAARKIPYEEVDIAAVRRYANARANTTSIRQIAVQTGLGHTTFYKFLLGSTPYARNRILLCEWFLREHLVHPVPEPLSITLPSPPETPEVHLEALLRDLRGAPRVEARMRIMRVIAQAYQRMGLPSPEWLYSQR